MARRYKRWSKKEPAQRAKNGGEGRRVVHPLKPADYAEMSRLALVHRDKAPKGSEEYYRWYRDWTLMLCQANCGNRVETILEWMPADLEGGMVTATESKTGKRAQYELNPDVYAEIKAYIECFGIGRHEFLFRTTRKSKDAITRQTAWRRIKALAKEAGVEYNVGTHSIRKMYARKQYDEGVDVHLISLTLQHSSVDVTKAYIGLEDRDVDRHRTTIRNIPVGGKP